MTYCKWGRHFTDSVPVPFGIGNCSMPGFECDYEGDKETLECCEENEKCPAFEAGEETNESDY